MCPDTIEPTGITTPLTAKPHGITPGIAPLPPPQRAKPRGRPLGSRNLPKDPFAAPVPVIKPAAMRPEQAAMYLAISTSTLRRLIIKGDVEKRRIGSAVVILTRSLDAFLERSK
jgi:excisionase family DNA binding protein